MPHPSVAVLGSVAPGQAWSMELPLGFMVVPGVNIPIFVPKGKRIRLEAAAKEEPMMAAKHLETIRQLQGYKALAEKATPGPWSLYTQLGMDDPTSADTLFVLAAREGWPATIAALEAAMEVLESVALQCRDGEDSSWCADCHRWAYRGHSPDCRLTALLAAWKESKT